MAQPYNWPAIRAGIFAGESGGDWDALFGYSNRQGGQFANTRLRDMTVDQALAFSDPRGPYAQWVKGKIGRVATPMGAYQIVGTTLRAAKDGLGLTGNEKMDEATQDRLGQWILAKQGTGAWEGYRGPRDPASIPGGPINGTGKPVGAPPPFLSGIGSPSPAQVSAQPFGGPAGAAPSKPGYDPSAAAAGVDSVMGGKQKIKMGDRIAAALQAAAKMGDGPSGGGGGSFPGGPSPGQIEALPNILKMLQRQRVG